MLNYLLSPLNDFYKEMASLEGRIHVLQWFLNRHREELQKNKGKGINFSQSILLTRDIVKFTPGTNLFHTGYGYKLKYDDISDEIDNILSREYCFSLSQLYEMVETFLMNILSEFLFRKQQHLLSLKISNSNIILKKTQIKTLVRETLGRKQNNKKLIWAIKKLSSHFVEHDSNNNYKVNLSEWFDLLSEARHNIIHNRQIMSERLLNYISINSRKKLFNYYFDRKNVHSEDILFLSFSKFSLNKDLIAQFAFLIFKSLSIDNSLDPTYQS